MVKATLNGFAWMKIDKYSLKNSIDLEKIQDGSYNCCEIYWMENFKDVEIANNLIIKLIL